MRTVVIGNRTLAKHVLAYLLKADWHVVGAVSAAGDAAQRQAGYVSFDDLAKRYGIELVATTDINTEETRSRLADLDPDLCICPGWHQIINEAVLDIPDRGFVGFHASDLPQGRGGAPVNWSIIHNEPEIVLTLFYYSKGVDAGDVIHKEYIEIENRDDVDTVLAKLAVAARDALTTTQEAFESGDVDATPQPLEEATYRPRRQPQDGLVDWSRPAPELRDRVRAQTAPYPGAYTFLNGNRITIWSAEYIDHSVDEFDPGTIVSKKASRGVDVASGEGVLRLVRVQRRGDPTMWGDRFMERHGLSRGDSLGREHAPESWLYTGIRNSENGTDLSNASNLRPGDRGEILAVIESATERRIEIETTFDGTNLIEESLLVAGRETIPVTYEPAAEGTHTLRIDFFRDAERIDTRYLKVFVAD